jgi:hypothetical protein
MKISLLLIAMAVPTVACLDGCSRRPDNPSAAPVGQYRLHWGSGSNCSGRGIENSTLELRAELFALEYAECPFPNELNVQRAPASRVVAVLAVACFPVVTPKDCECHGSPIRGDQDNRRDNSNKKSTLRRFYAGKRMAPQVGLEPTTLRLTAGCSAIELLRSVGKREPNPRFLSASIITF